MQGVPITETKEFYVITPITTQNVREGCEGITKATTH